MAEGISPNKLNDISKVYLDTIYKHNTGENRIDQEREKWSKSVETQKEGYKGTADLSKADPEAKKKVEDRIEKWAGKRVPGGKKGVKESFSNWRTDLREISDAIPETEKKTEKEVTEKKVKNKIEINPKISEAVAEMGGEVLSIKEGPLVAAGGILGGLAGGALAAGGAVAGGAVKGVSSIAAASRSAASQQSAVTKRNQARQKKAEQDAADIEAGVKEQIETAPVEEDPALKAKDKRQAMIKKQVLNKKLMAVRQGAGADITASYDPIEAAAEYFYEEGINEEGIDLLIEEIGLDEFVEFVSDDVELLNEQRAARKASVRAKKYPQVKAEVDKADAARKAAKKGEYAPSYAKKETDVTVYDDKAPAKKKAAAKKAPAGMKKAVARKKAVLQQPVKKTAPKPKVVKAVAKVKKTQPAKKPSKQGLVSKISTAYKKGLERHKAARAKGRVPEKRVKEFGKGFASGVKDTVKFAKKAKKAVVGEAYKKKKKHNCASKVKHEEYGMGNCIPEMHTLDEDGNVTHYDVMFESKIVKNIPVSSLEIIEGKFHEHYINYEKNVEVVNELFGVMGAAATKKKGTSKPQNVTFGGNRTDKRKGPVPDTKMKDYKGSPSFQKMMAKRKKVNEDKALEMVRAAIIKKHGKGAIYDPKNPPKSSPQPKRKPEKDTRSAAQREVDAQYGRTPWNKKGSLGT